MSELFGNPDPGGWAVGIFSILVIAALYRWCDEFSDGNVGADK